MWSRKELKTRAKAVLKISYWKAFLVSLIVAFAGGSSGFGPFNFGGSSGSGDGGNFQDFAGSSPESILEMLPFILIGIAVFLFIMLLVFAFRVFLGYPLEVGGRRYFVQAAQDNVDMNSLGYAFEKPKYFDIIKAMLWRGFINFLWYLLLIIPGIVKSYAYSMVPYILADNPKIGYRRALELSNDMTKGQKFAMFVLDLSFIGWYLLGMLALFIGIIFVMPYVNATKGELYLVLRQNALDKGLCSNEELLLDNPI